MSTILIEVANKNITIRLDLDTHGLDESVVCDVPEHYVTKHVSAPPVTSRQGHISCSPVVLFEKLNDLLFVLE